MFGYSNVEIDDIRGLGYAELDPADLYDVADELGLTVEQLMEEMT